jgi:phosphomannomutase
VPAQLEEVLAGQAQGVEEAVHGRQSRKANLAAAFGGDESTAGALKRQETALPTIAALFKEAPSPMQVDATIFKAYDIRGIVGKTLNEEVAEHIGRAFGTEARAAGEKAVVVGRDGRVSGPALVAALTRGLRASGIDVVDIGMVTTPMTYYVAATRGDQGCHSCVMVTGSHNPKDYNGFKMVLAGRAVYGEEIQGLLRRIQNEDYANGRGRLGKMDIGAEYLARIVSDCKLARPMKVVVDSGNGVPGASAPSILRALGCEVVDIYSEVDGDFPNHHPDPSRPENLEDLKKIVHATGAELGLAFDGDGDRLGIVTKDGQMIMPDRQLMVLAKDILSRNKGAQIIYDVKCTQRLAPWIRKHGGKPLMWKTGHSLAKAKLRETGAPIAGELSGHIFFNERWYGFDDAMYTAARMLEILSREKDPSKLLNSLPDSVNTPELNVPCAEGEHHAVVAELQKIAQFPNAQDVITIDGLRVEYADGFGLVRASNTTPVLVLRFEGHTAEALERIQAEVLAQLRRVKADIHFQAGH